MVDQNETKNFFEALNSHSITDRVLSAGNLRPETYDIWLEHLLDGCPSKTWPFGMPSSVNPSIIFVGIGPGDSASRGENTIDYTELSTGRSHPGLYYRDTSNYWDKVRTLSKLVLRTFPEFQDCTEDNLLANVGHLNLAISSSGTGKGLAKPDYARWAFSVIEKIRPKVVILVGSLGEIKRREISNAFNFNSGECIDWKHPTNQIKFAPSPQYSVRFWETNMPTLFTSLPNHFSRHGMNKSGALEEVASQIIKRLGTHQSDRSIDTQHSSVLESEFQGRDESPKGSKEGDPYGQAKQVIFSEQHLIGAEEEVMAKQFGYPIKLENVENGIKVSQYGKAYIAKRWILNDDVERLVWSMLDTGMSCMIREKHPLPSRLLPDGEGVVHLSFSPTPKHDWAMAIDRPNLDYAAFNGKYREQFEAFNIPFEFEKRNKKYKHMEVKWEHLFDAIHQLRGMNHFLV